MKYLKYVLAVATLLLACATFALADESATVVTVNGQSFSSLEDAFSASSPGSQIVLTSNITVSSSLSIPNGTTFNIPSGISLDLDGVGIVLNNANMNVYGDVISTRTGQFGAIAVQNNAILNVYGGIISSSASDTGIFCASTGTDCIVNVYSGRIQGFVRSIYVTSTWIGSINIFGGEFLPKLDLYPQVNLMNGSTFVPGTDNSIVSWGGLYQISSIVTSALTWISLFCAAIFANKLLLFFVLFVLGFVAIGCIKRIINN